MSDFLRFKTSSPAGDLLSLLPSIRQLYRLTGKKAIIYQALNVVGQGLQGYNQAFLNNEGESIMMSGQTFNMLLPLINYLEYVDHLEVFHGQEVDYDLDEIRLKTFTNQPLGSINRWPFYVFPETACDLSEAWIQDIPKHPKYIFSDKIVINFTPRYRNNWINYYFLREHQDRLLFAGLPKEHDDFCDKWGLLNLPYLQYKDFRELAIIMSDCRFYMGNATMTFQIAEGLKIPRLLETFQVLPNVIPFGKNGFDAYHQGAMEFYFRKLISQ